MIKSKKKTTKTENNCFLVFNIKRKTKRNQKILMKKKVDK